MKRSRICRGWMVVLGLGILVAFGCGPARYDKADLADPKVKEIRGVVIKQSLGSIVLQDDGGMEKTLRTGECTQYIPDDYRSQQGDRVRVAFREVVGRSDVTKKIFAVLQLEALEIPDYNQPLPNPIEGVVLRYKYGSASHFRKMFIKLTGSEDEIPIYIHVKAEINDHGKQWEVNSSGLNKLIGKMVQVDGKRIPIARGNGYIYETYLITVP